MKFEELKDLIVKLPELSAAAEVSKKVGHDPFKGHYPEDIADATKSVFDEEFTVNGELRTTPHLDTEKVKILYLAFVGKTISETAKNVIGIETFTDPNPGKHRVTAQVVKVHGGLQLKSKDFHLNYAPTGLISAVMTYEPDLSDWALASVHPGKAGIDVGAELDKLGLKEGYVLMNVDPLDYVHGLFDHVIVES